jgi:hypothetical protein
MVSPKSKKATAGKKSQPKPKRAKPARAKPTRAKRANAKPVRAKPARAKPARAKPANPRTRHHDADFEPFAITASDIEAFDDLQFRRFMRELLRNEVFACNCGPARFVDNPGDGNDQGQDAETVRAPESSPTDTFIPIGTTVWQYKAEKKPPSESDLKAEIEKQRPITVLANGGNYRFAAQQPRTNESATDAMLRRIARRKHYGPARVGFHAQATLAERARRYPSLALLDFLKRRLEQVHPFEWWSKEHAATTFDLDSRSGEVKKLLDFIRTAPRPTHIRVVGPAGVGKTRLVLHALEQLDLGACTAYAPSANTGGFNAFFKWCGEQRSRVVLVVDECDEPTAGKLRDSIVLHDLPIILITINKIEDGDTKATSRDLRVHVAPMSEDDIVRILDASTKLGKTRIFAISRITGGFVKLAQVVAEAVERDQTGAFDPAALVTVDVIRDAVRSLLGVSGEALRWLGMVALFSEVSTSGSDAGSEIALLAAFAGVTIQDVRSWNRRAITTQVLSDRGDGVFVTPSLLAVLLARDVIRDRRLDLGNWLRKLPPRLQEAFASQLGQLRYSDEGIALSQELIGIDGPFGDLLTERQPWAREAFLALGSVAKGEALTRMEAWVRDVDTAAEELSRDTTLERLLFRLIWRPEHFAQSFRLILCALTAANEPMSSGLHDVMSGSLQLTLANSKAPFLDRLAAAARVVKDSTQRTEVRRLVLRALAAGVDSSTGDGYSHDDIDVDGREYWHAKTYGELWECARAVVNFLVEMLSSPDEKLRQEAAENLIDHAAHFIRIRAHEPLLAAVDRILSIDPRVGKLREEMERCLAVDHLADDIDHALRSAIAGLPRDLPARIRVLVEGWPLFRDRDDRGLPERPDPVLVASEIMASADRPSVIAQLFEPWAKNAGDLLAILAKRPDASEAWPAVLAAARRSGETWGAALFLAVAHDGGAPQFQHTAVELLAHGEPYDVHLGAEAITRMESSDDDVAAVSQAVASGRVQPSGLRYAIVGRWSERHQPAAVAGLIRAAASAKGGLMIALALILAAEANLSLTDGEIIDILTASMFDVQGHDAWTWEQVATKAAARAPRALGAALIAHIRDRSAREHRYRRWSMDKISGVLDECIDAQPDLARELLELWDHAPEFVESQGTAALMKYLDANALGDWARDVRREQALARIIVAAPNPTTDALLGRFGADSPFALALREQLYPRSWSGSLTRLLRSRAEQTRMWSDDATRPSEFRQWARAASMWLDSAAEHAKRYDD